MFIFSSSVTTLLIPISAAAGNKYFWTLVILEDGKDIDVSNKFIDSHSSTSHHTISPSPCPAKLQNNPTGSFYVLPYNKSNPNILVLAAPTNNLEWVSFFSAGSHEVIFAIRHYFIILSIPVNFTSWWPDLMFRSLADLTFLPQCQ